MVTSVLKERTVSIFVVEVTAMLKMEEIRSSDVTSILKLEAYGPPKRR